MLSLIGVHTLFFEFQRVKIAGRMIKYYSRCVPVVILCVHQRRKELPQSKQLMYGLQL